MPFGIADDRPAVADFDGDGKADIAVYRPSLGNWYGINRQNRSFYGVHFGFTGEMIVPADYTEDGKTDLLVFRPTNETFFLQQSTSGFAAVHFGQNGDRPTPNSYYV